MLLFKVLSHENFKQLIGVVAGDAGGAAGGGGGGGAGQAALPGPGEGGRTPLVQEGEHQA
jgi:hypothetical protein